MRFLDVFKRCEGDSAKLDPLKINDDFIKTMSVNGVMMDGVLEFVKKIKTGIEDARIYVITNGAAVNAKGRITSTGLDRYIDGLFVSEDMGVTKPSKAYFDMCLKQIGEPKESCIVIGDSLSSDMLGAKNASLCSVWFMPVGDIADAMRAYEIDSCASSFDELYSVHHRPQPDSASCERLYDIPASLRIWLPAVDGGESVGHDCVGHPLVLP